MYQSIPSLQSFTLKSGIREFPFHEALAIIVDFTDHELLNLPIANWLFQRNEKWHTFGHEHV